ncbi:hypothetical protein TVAG_444210 [Trichomonas vaginalis G3]|uniref:TAF6 C-terminal HEAT repeat domain-containing protein n=1 Tax=Trichomonas vaginalis (strain ATCC PRA-98 / G3) TaxID=412133 RepID=A2E2G3_TRIV3|nr:transcription initiation factor TFIID family [Trichomonas vaginalis G3]EAY13138.1 hypothetical protein TVAG_444210 [Trichomonas vaginalis G3]KAI5528239.1 transcription initiation factor TFIID family [Trichomonas vaginalis G3]|eukprot:XP_001325361.1 hypothetical protein [Trichomonas vaginalis G3]
MSDPSVAAVNAAANALGIQFARPDVAQGLAQDAEFRISQLIQPIVLLKQITNSKRLTCEHINSVLPYFQQNILLGYSERDDYDIQQITAPDKSIIYFAEDTKVPLQNITQEVQKEPQRASHFKFQWKMVNGAKFDEAAMKNSFNTDKVGMIAPITNIFANQFAQNTDFSTKAENTKLSLPEDLIDYFNDATDILSSENFDTLEFVYPKLQTDIGTAPLLPFFLKYFYAEIAEYLDNSSRMIPVARATLALVSNTYLPISLYVHSFLKIAFTLSQTVVVTNNLINDECIRQTAGDIIIALIKRASSEYPGIRTEIFNQLVGVSFNPETNYPALYGALYTLLNLDDDAFRTVIPHAKVIAERCIEDNSNSYADATHRMIKNTIKSFMNNHTAIDKKFAEVLKNFP